MINCDDEMSELIMALDEKHLQDAGYISMTITNQAKGHDYWKPSLFLEDTEGKKETITGEKKILDKLKEIYNFSK